jgi:hypothetical protein
MTMGSHQSARMVSDTWLTPPAILKALGPFDLDPCCPENMPWPTAARCYTPADDGLAQPWEGRVWLNPPYSREAVRWLEKMAQHGDGIALIFARTETEWFWRTVWKAATACLFLKGRLYFHWPNGERANANAGAPSVLAAYGAGNAETLRTSGIQGAFVHVGATT